MPQHGQHNSGTQPLFISPRECTNFFQYYWPIISTRQKNLSAAESSPSTPDCMDYGTLTDLEKSCPLEVQQVLINSRNQSSKRSYLKRTRFVSWISKKQRSTTGTSPVHSVTFIQLKRSDLSTSSLKEHLAAIVAHHALTDNKSVCT